MNTTADVLFGPDDHLYVASMGSNSVMRYDGATGAPLPGPLALLLSDPPQAERNRAATTRLAVWNREILMGGGGVRFLGGGELGVRPRCE